MKVLTPPNYVNIDRPVLFLAGPIKGAVDWQSEAIKIVSQAELDIYIANPRKPGRKAGKTTKNHKGLYVVIEGSKH